MNLKEINYKSFLNFFDFDTLRLYLMRLLLIQLTTHQETSDHVLLKIFTALRLFEYNHFLKVELQVWKENKTSMIAKNKEHQRSYFLNNTWVVWNHEDKV